MCTLRRLLRRYAVLLALCAAVSIAACGGEDGATATRTQSSSGLTLAQWGDRFEATCQRTIRDLQDRGLDRDPGGRGKQAMAKRADRMAGNLDILLDRLGKLPLPERKQDIETANRVIDLMLERVQVLEVIARAIRRGSKKDLEKWWDHEAEIARDYGAALKAAGTRCL